jgi:hypothetical protein
MRLVNEVSGKGGKESTGKWAGEVGNVLVDDEGVE